MTPNQLLELTAYQSLCLQYGAYGPYLAALEQTRAWLNGRSSTRCYMPYIGEWDASRFTPSS